METNFTDESKLFFTSDTHFGHENIIKLCHRPFSSVEEMNEKLIENWNSVVGPDDDIFHLGDFALGGSNLWNDVLSRLNGKKHLILGNHDLKNFRHNYAPYFEDISMERYILVNGKGVYLNHCPFLCYGGVYREEPIWQLFGHVHSGPNSTSRDTDRLSYLFPAQYDVGVDNNNFKPISFAEIHKIMQERGIK